MLQKYQDESLRFLSDGYVLIPGLLTAEEVQILVDAAHADSTMLNSAFELADTAGARIRLSGWNYAGDHTLGLIARLPRIVDRMEAFLGDEVYHYHSKMILKEPRAGGAWEWHQDYGYWYQNGCLFPNMASCLIAVDPATRANGCLEILKGSHRMGRIEHGRFGGQTGADPEHVGAARECLEHVYCEMDPGTALFFHAKLLRLAGAHLPLAGHHADAGNARSGRISLRGPRGDPFQERSVFWRALLDSKAAPVRDARRRLLQHQALFRRRGEDPPPAPLFEQGQPIGVRIEPEDRQLKAVLSLGLAMTAGRIAAKPAQDGENIVLKMERTRRVRAGHSNGNRACFPADGHFDLGLAIRDALRHAVGADLDNRRVPRAEEGAAREVNDPAVGRRPADEQRITTVRAGKRQMVGFDAERRIDLFAAGRPVLTGQRGGRRRLAGQRERGGQKEHRQGERARLAHSGKRAGRGGREDKRRVAQNIDVAVPSVERARREVQPVNRSADGRTHR